MMVTRQESHLTDSSKWHNFKSFYLLNHFSSFFTKKFSVVIWIGEPCSHCIQQIQVAFSAGSTQAQLNLRHILQMKWDT